MNNDAKFISKETANLVTFSEENPNGRLHFLCSTV